MSELMDTLDIALANAEADLLAELHRLRKLQSMEPYIDLDPNLKEALHATSTTMRQNLDNSGDRTNLSLRTRRHEVIQARLNVVLTLLQKPIPTAFIEISHQEIVQTRRQAEKEVAQLKVARTTDTPLLTSTEPEKKGSLFGRLLRKKNPHSPQKPVTAKPRTSLQITLVTEDEVKNLDWITDYLDNGFYSDSRELAVLSEQVVLHRVEGRSIGEITKARAQFAARDLSSAADGNNQASPKKFAQSPEDIRRKLENRKADNQGASTFGAKELSNASPLARNTKAPAKSPLPEIALSPDAIRRKLESQKATMQASNKGASIFAAKELSGGTPQFSAAKTPTKPSKPEIAQSPGEIRKKLAARQRSEQPSNKAVFGATDVEPNTQAPAPRAEPENLPTKPTGKAVFQSKDRADD